MNVYQENTLEKKVDRRTRKTKAALHNAFLSILAEKPLSKISVKELTEKADIDRKTFYLHYGSMDDLVDELMREDIERASSAVSEVSLDENGKVDVTKMFEVLVAEIAPSLNERAAVLSHVDTDVFLDRLEPLLAQAIIQKDAHGLTKHVGPYFDLCVTFYCAGILAVFRKWLDDDSELPLEGLAGMSAAAVSGAINSVIEVSHLYVPAKR